MDHGTQARLQGAGDLVPPRRAPQGFHVIGLAGPIGSGKSTAAEFFYRTYKYRRISFAEPLKNMLRVIGLGDRELYGDLKEVPSAKLNGRTPRHAMQTLGTEWGRDCLSPTFWTDNGIRRALEAKDCGLPGVVFDDCRFSTEADAIRAVGGRIIMLAGRSVVTDGPKHPSEALDFTPDVTIANTGSLMDLERALMRDLTCGR